MNIYSASEAWLTTVRGARAYKTFESYRSARDFFMRTLKRKKIDPEKTDAQELNQQAISWLLSDLKRHTPATESAYTTAIHRFYRYLLAEELARFNPIAVEEMIRQRARRPGRRIPQFYEDEITQVIEAILANPLSTDPAQRLRDLRDRALLTTLGDSGLRIHEALKLTVGDVDWRRQRAIIIGKGDKEAVIRLTTRSVRALKEYLSARRKLDGATGKPLATLPLFARHDTGVGKKIEPITTTTGRTIVQERVATLVSDDAAKRITPHSFRHWFVTKVLRRHQNLKLAQALARHENIAITQRYAHITDAELDRGFHEAMEE